MGVAVFLGNSMGQWLLASGACALILAVPLTLSQAARRYAGRAGAEQLPVCLAEVLGGTSSFLLLVMGLCTGSRFLELSARTATGVDEAALVALLLQVGIYGNRAIGWWLRNCLARRETNPGTAAMTAPVLGFIFRLVFWTVLLLMVMASFGINLNAFLASLGVGGIAVALAVQNILGDIFASLSITLDKPFVLGDFIIVGDCLGTVDTIGLKSTQIRSLSGEVIIMSNLDLLKSRIRNFKRMSERRVLFTFGVAYGTEAGQLEKIPGFLRGIIEAQAEARFDRAHLREFGDSAMIYEVVYYVRGADYNLYMDIQQAINLALLRALQAEGIRFAHPVRQVMPAPAESAPERE